MCEVYGVQWIVNAAWLDSVAIAAGERILIASQPLTGLGKPGPPVVQLSWTACVPGPLNDIEIGVIVAPSLRAKTYEMVRGAAPLYVIVPSKLMRPGQVPE